MFKLQHVQQNIQVLDPRLREDDRSYFWIYIKDYALHFVCLVCFVVKIFSVTIPYSHLSFSPSASSFP
jgi:hypothetical protein